MHNDYRRSRSLTFILCAYCIYDAQRKMPIGIYFIDLDNESYCIFRMCTIYFLFSMYCHLFNKFVFLFQIIFTFYIKQALKFKHSLHRLKNKALHTKNSDVENLC
jgi:hypothetical protein